MFYSTGSAPYTPPTLNFRLYIGMWVVMTLILSSKLTTAQTMVTLSADTFRISFDLKQVNPDVINQTSAYSLDSKDHTIVAVGLLSLPVGKVESPWPPRAVVRHDVFVRIHPPLVSGQTVRVTLPTDFGGKTVPLSYDETAPSLAIRLSQVGYLPNDQSKAATIGYYLGSLGALETPVLEFHLIEKATNKVVFRGRPEQRFGYRWLYGQTLWHCPFGGFSEPGEYIVVVPGIGRSLPFRIGPDVYDDPMRLILRTFYHHRCGEALSPKITPYHRSECHAGDKEACFHKGITETPLYAGEKPGSCIDVTGGWHDASDYGKYVPTATAALFNLLFAFEMWPQKLAKFDLGIGSHTPQTPDLLTEIAVEVDWLLKMQAKDGGVYHKVTSEAWGTDKLPQHNVHQRWIAEKTTHATARAGAIFERASRVFMTTDTLRAKRYAAAADMAWKYLVAHPKTTPSPGFSNREWTGGGEYGDRFGDDDERTWILVERACSGKGQSELVVSTLLRHVPQPYQPRVPPLRVHDWPPPFEDSWRAALLTVVTCKTVPTPDGLREAIIDSYRERRKDLVDYSFKEPFGLSYLPDRGQPFGYGTSNGARWAMDLALADLLLGPDVDSTNAWLRNLAVLFGHNGVGMSFVTGVGQRSPIHVEYRINELDGIEPPLPGHVVDGPATFVQSSNKDIDARLYPKVDLFPPGLRYFDLMDPVISEPTILEQSEAVLALVAWVKQ